MSDAVIVAIVTGLGAALVPVIAWMRARPKERAEAAQIATTNATAATSALLDRYEKQNVALSSRIDQLLGRIESLEAADRAKARQIVTMGAHLYELDRWVNRAWRVMTDEQREQVGPVPVKTDEGDV